MPEIKQEEKDNALWFVNFGQPLISLLNRPNNLSELYSSFSKQIKINSQTIVEASRTVHSAIERYGLFTQDFYKNISIVQNQIETFRESYKSILEVINQDLYKLGDLAKTIRDRTELEDSVLLESGWWITPVFNDLPFDLMDKAVIDYRNGNRKSITTFMKNTLHRGDYSLLKKMVESWESNSLFKQRMKPIRQALDAHIKKQYYLSIPTLLAISEGVAAEYCKAKNLLTERKYRSLGGRKIKEAISHKSKSPDFKLYSPDVFLFHIQNMIFADTDLLEHSKNRKLLNRHGILHGNLIKYGDCPRSLRCFLLLDALSTLESKPNKENRN